MRRRVIVRGNVTVTLGTVMRPVVRKDMQDP